MSVPGLPAGPVRGRIVLLNGTSSSGKSALAGALLDVLPGFWSHVPVDAFHAMRARAPGSPPEEVLRATRAGYHRAVAGLADACNDVVMDHVLSEPWRLADCLEVFRGYDVLLVGVHCDLSELRRRELARGDRPVGLAEQQLPLVHAHGEYDVEIDTTSSSAVEGAREIASAVADPPSVRAFDRLRAER